MIDLFNKVNVGDVPTAQCSSVSDPHITTFNRLIYRHYISGDYMLVKSEARLFEVGITIITNY